MWRFGILIVLALVIARTGTAAAQPAVQSGPMTAELLEKLVSDEVAKSGVVLSQRHLRLQIEQLEDRWWMVSLVDLVTEHAEAKATQLPPEREAAVTVMSRLVIELAEQLSSLQSAALPPVPAAPVSTPLPEVHAERVRRDLDALAALDSLQFERVYGVEIGRGLGTRRWLELRNNSGDACDAPEPRLAGRKDRVELYYQRHFAQDKPLPARICPLWLDACQGAPTPDANENPYALEHSSSDSVLGQEALEPKTPEGTEKSTSSSANLNTAESAKSTTTSPSPLGTVRSAKNEGPLDAVQFERLVPEQLELFYGVVLSRHKVRLKVDHLGDWWLVSLVDITYQYDVRSTRLGKLPTDREAALATMTHVVNSLDSQLGDRSVSRPRTSTELRQPPPAVPQVTIPPNIRAIELARRKLAELRFKQLSLKIDTTFDSHANQGLFITEPRWRIIRGGAPLDSSRFYEVIGRDDLAQTYHWRRIAATGSYLLGVAIMTVSNAWVLDSLHGLTTCNVAPATMRSQSTSCAIFPRLSLLPLLIGYGSSITITAVGHYIDLNSDPINRAEASKIVKNYNSQLHRHLGLSAVSTLNSRGFRLTPYVASNEAGVAVSSQF